MKKTIAFLLILASLFVCIPFTVLADEIVPLEGSSKLDTLNDAVVEKSSNIQDRLISTLRTTDEVEVNDEEGIVSVVTSEGIKLTAEVPFGTVCLTQDLFQQLELYQSLYADIGRALENYISKGVHMNIYNFFTNTDAFVAVSAQSIAALVGDANSLTDKEAKYILNYISKNWYAGINGEIKSLNGIRYFVFDLHKDNGVIIYETFIGGQDVTVTIRLDPENTFAMDDVAAIMNGLKIELA